MREKVTLRQLREERSWTQWYVAVQLGVTITTVQAWENNRAEPRITHIEALLALYSVDFHDVLWPGRRKPPQPPPAS